MRDEEKTGRFFTDSVDHLQLGMQIEMKWSKQSKAELWHLLTLSEFAASFDFNYFGSIDISNTFWNKHLHQDFPVAFTYNPQFEHEDSICFPRYRLGIARVYKHYAIFVWNIWIQALVEKSNINLENIMKDSLWISPHSEKKCSSNSSMCYRPMQIIGKYCSAEQLFPQDPTTQELQICVKGLLTD